MEAEIHFGLPAAYWASPVAAGRPQIERRTHECVRPGEVLRRAPRPASAFSRQLKSAPQGACARRRPPPTQKPPPGQPRPTTGRRLLCRLKSAFSGAARRASASADAQNAFRSAQADHRPKAFVPIEIGLPKALRATRRPPPTQRTPSRSAQADHRPKASRGRIHSAPRPTTSQRLLCRLKSAPQGACAPRVGLRRRKERFPVGAGRPPAKGLSRPNSFGAGRPPTKGFCAD